MGKILSNRNRYLIPFMFQPRNEQEFDQLVLNMKQIPEWKMDDMHSEGVEQDVYNIVLNCFAQNKQQSNLGCSFIYQPEKKPIVSLNYSRFEDNYVVFIWDMGLFLFRTGVGFLWYEFSIPKSTSMGQFVLFQNEFKELSYERFVTRRDDGQNYTFSIAADGNQPLLMGHWLDEVLKSLPFSYDYFASRKDPLDSQNRICDKALIFLYLAADDIDSNEEVFDDLYHLTNGYNARYQRKDRFLEDIIEPFHNAFCYASASGCGYFVVPEKSNMNFYLKTFKKKFMLDYFLLYVLAQYQSYSLLKFTKEMQDELTAEPGKYLTNSEDTLHTLKQLETKINVFLIKSVYSSVSHIGHQNDYYDYLIRRMKVHENIDGLTVGLESLQKLQESRERDRLAEIEKQENLEQEVSDDRLNIGLGLISILAIISAIADGNGSASAIVSLFHLPMFVKDVITGILLGIIVIIAVFAIASLIPSIRRMRAKRKKIKPH